jgi:hypothetical protein
MGCKKGICEVKKKSERRGIGKGKKKKEYYINSTESGANEFCASEIANFFLFIHLFLN